MGDAGGDLAGGEGLDDRQRAVAGGERAKYDALQCLIVLAEDEIAEPPPHLRLDRCELPLDLLHIGAARGQLGLDLRIVGAEAELDAAVGNEVFDPGQQLIDMRLAEPIGMKALQMDRGRRSSARQEARDDLLFEHAVQLARHSGGEEKPSLADVEREAAGGADRVVEDLGGGRQHRLLRVVRRHDPVAAAEEILHAPEPILVEDELDPGGARRDLLRQIVDGRARARH